MTPTLTRRLALSAMFLLGVTASTVADARSRGDEQQLVDDATRTFNELLADRNMGWLRANMRNARGVLIAPRIVKAGFIIGGSGGNAVLVTRGRDGTWAGPAFYNLSTGSVGFQAGVAEARSVTLAMTQKAVDRLMTGSVRFGGDLSIATGPVGGGANTNVRADLVTFNQSKGVFGGVNMEGTGVGTDSSRNAAFFGAGATPTDILVTRTVKPNPGAAQLLRAVSAAAR